MKLYSALYQAQCPWDKYDIEYALVPDDLTEPDGFLVLWGGEDISPSIYGETPNRFTHASARLSYRDAREIALARKAIQIGMPIVGICRGAQLMCALSGGKLIQHVEDHHGSHPIKTNDGKTLTTNSIHHQMMFPFDIEHELIAWSSHRISPCYVGEGNKQLPAPKVEPEIVYFPQTNSLGIQGHPEYLTPDNEFVQYCHTQMEKYLAV